MIEVVIFALKALIVVLSLGSLIVLIAMMAARASHKTELEIEPLHERYKDFGHFLRSYTLEKDELKKLDKEEKAAEKKRLKAEKKAEKENSSTPAKPKKKVFVVNFDGDVHASDVDKLREEITAILQVATADDEVVAKVESPGGVVHGYGLAASQLLRIREHNIPLTVCVDQVAASGGYMMACVANRIVAAPFAIVGSIGVVAQVPNFHRVLKKYDVDYKEYTAGDYKRTVSLLGEITPKGEEKFQERLVDTHVLFKAFVQKFRPQVDLDKVATGEYWFGEEALKLNLVDVLKTSDDYLLSFEKDTPIFEIKYELKKTFADKISEMTGKVATQTLLKIWSRLETSRFL